MRKILLLILFVLLNLSASAQVTVYLKSGRQMSGDLISIDETKVVIGLSSSGGTMKTSFSKEEVDKIEGFPFDEFLRATKTYEAVAQGGEAKGFDESFKNAKKLVEEKRNRSFVLEVKQEFISQDKLKEYMQKKIETLKSQEDFEKERKLLVKLGIIDGNIDYREMVVDLMTHNVAGFYEPKENKMYIVEETASVFSPFLPSEVVVHELVHAMQDQYVFLDNFEEDLATSTIDKSLALKSVIEGEATFVSYSIFSDFIKKAGSNSAYKERIEAFDLERFILESQLLAAKSLSQEFKQKGAMHYLLFPYINGGTFVKYAFDNGGWQKVDTIYKNPPLSTEQIIHPEKYFLVEDKPLPLAPKNLDFLKNQGFGEISSGVLGEFTLYTLALSFLDELYAKMISSGWGNDNYYLYEKEGKMVLVIDSRWDSPQEAEEFFKGMKALMDKKYAQLNWQEAKDTIKAANDNNLIYLGKKGDEVLTVELEGTDSTIFKEIIEAFSSTSL
jgi:hypothetical protein